MAEQIYLLPVWETIATATTTHQYSQSADLKFTPRGLPLDL